MDIDAKDRYGRTPLSWAAGGGHKPVVWLLIERNDVDVDAKDNDGRTPLSWAAWSGHKDLLQLLLEQANITLDVKDIPALDWATNVPDTKVIEFLQTVIARCEQWQAQHTSGD